MNCLCYIIKETDAKIIITSSWRKYPNHVEKFIEVFKEYHLEQHIIGFTPITGNREEEINLTLQQFNEEINFIILNDYMTSLELNEHLIQTDNQYGLTYEEALEAISRLNARHL